jgi:hypothetical protein
MAARSAAASRHGAGATNGTHAGATVQVPNLSGPKMYDDTAVVLLATNPYRAL